MKPIDSTTMTMEPSAYFYFDDTSSLNMTRSLGHYPTRFLKKSADEHNHKLSLAEQSLTKLVIPKEEGKKYIALVWGNVKEDQGTITGHIARHLRNRKIMDVYSDGERGKHAISHYTVLERFGYTTLIECRLETGRTHQIRAHFKYIGHPLFNDSDYGGDNILKGTKFTKYKQFVQNCFKVCNRQALHAKSLGFIHPKTQKKVFFDSNLPEDMQQLVDKWSHYAQHQKI